MHRRAQRAESDAHHLRAELNYHITTTAHYKHVHDRVKDAMIKAHTRVFYWAKWHTRARRIIRRQRLLVLGLRAYVALREADCAAASTEIQRLRAALKVNEAASSLTETEMTVVRRAYNKKVKQ